MYCPENKYEYRITKIRQSPQFIPRLKRVALAFHARLSLLRDAHACKKRKRKKKKNIGLLEALFSFLLLFFFTAPVVLCFCSSLAFFVAISSPFLNVEVDEKRVLPPELRHDASALRSPGAAVAVGAAAAAASGARSAPCLV